MVGYVIICTFSGVSTVYGHKVFKNEEEALKVLNEYNEKLEKDLDMTFVSRGKYSLLTSYLNNVHNISESRLYRNTMCRLSKNFEEKHKEYVEMGKCVLNDASFLLRHRSMTDYKPEDFENDEYCEFLMCEKATPARIVKVEY